MPHDQRAYETEWQLKQLGAAEAAFQVTDPLHVAHAARNKMSPGFQIYYGHIADAVPFCHCYRVLLENGRLTMPCTMLTQTPLLPYGAKQITSLPAGCRVWVLVHPQSFWGFIIGVAPRYNDDPKKVWSDFIHQASRCGVHVDQYQRGPLQLQRSGTVTNHSMGRPMDTTGAGEWGAITETGLKITLDPFMAQLAVDEATGVFAFYHDSLLRVAGINMQQFSMAHSLDAVLDQGEANLIFGATPFPNEQLGALKPDKIAIKEITAEQMQKTEPWLGSCEPKEDDQIPFHRSLAFHGYLGQGGSRWVQSPQDGADFNRLSIDLKHNGLIREHLGLNGSYGLVAAQGITIAKKLLIPVPKQKKPFAAAAGDTEENYKFAGLKGSGEAHKVPGQVKVPEGSVGKAMLSAAGLMDSLAYIDNWEAVHPFFYHKMDWYFPEIEDLELNSTEFAPVAFASLGSVQYLEPPAEVAIPGDDRGEAKGYPNVSIFRMAPDGGVVIGDGFGSEIRMAGGNIEISAPGDIWFRSGRNVIQWAGRDSIIRSGNSVDISASDKDVRIKAEGNMQLLAGNGGIGGILLESKATGPISEFAGKTGEDVGSSGVMVKCKNSMFTSWSAGAYLRTGGGDVSGGPIIIDSDKGQQPIYTRSFGFLRYVNNMSADYFGSGASASAVFLVTNAGILVNGNAAVLGSSIVAGVGAFGGSVVCLGHFASPPGGDVGKLRNSGAVTSAIVQVSQAAATSREQANSVYQSIFEEFLYAEDRPGNDDTIEAASFSYRTKDQLRVPDDFVLYESRWQQMARIANSGLSTWTEKPVTVGSQEMYPYPSKEIWDKSGSFCTLNLKLYDLEAGYPKSRAGNQSSYEQAELHQPTPSSLNEGYLIIP